jgi:DNA-binding LytR/AlgR family response regulator
MMSIRTIQDQVTARKTLVQHAAHTDANAPACSLRGAEMFSTRNKRSCSPGAAEEQYFEALDTSSTPVIRADAASLMQVSPPFESIAKRQGPRIAFKARGTILLLNLFDIVAVQAEGNYVSLQYQPHHYLVHESLSSMADKLKPYGFIRIHRSVVVNISAVEEIQPLTTGESRLRVRGGKEYLVTRTYKHNLRDLAQLWIGTERLCT